MISKLLRPGIQWPKNILLKRKVNRIICRKSGDMLPPSQYDIRIPKRLHLSYAMKEHFEIIPLVLVTFLCFGFLFFSIAWACKTKVDVVFTSRSRDNISRTMDLRNPVSLKLLTINQRYEAWPEMQAVLDKMRAAEKKL